ncbi:MAG: DUF1320 domain-containing protein [Ignavibacteria bacterium]|nr:DUF1320 domain-containing protein [Ignavibacteria bacterium]
MAVYLTSQELIDYVSLSVAVRLSNDVVGATVVETAPINAAVDTADSIIDSYLRTRYALPLPTVPPSVKQCALQIARKLLYERKGAKEMPEGVTDSYDDALQLMRNYSTGIMLLDIGQPANEQPAPTTVTTNKTSADRVFTRDYLDLY